LKIKKQITDFLREIWGKHLTTL